MPAQDSTYISYDFQCDAADHRDGKGCRVTCEGIGEDEAEEGEGEEREEDGVGGKGDSVEVVGAVDGAGG